MIGLYLYVMLSIIMSVIYTGVIYQSTELDDLNSASTICFLIYFSIANLLAWPIFTILWIIVTAEAVKNDR